MSTIHDDLRESAETAFFLAQDGAFVSAAATFRRIAATYENRFFEFTPGAADELFERRALHEAALLGAA